MHSPLPQLLPEAWTLGVNAAELGVQKVTRTTIDLHWEPPEDAAVQEYLVEYRDPSGAPVSKRVANTDLRVENLKPGDRLTKVRRWLAESLAGCVLACMPWVLPKAKAKLTTQPSHRCCSGQDHSHHGG